MFNSKFSCAALLLTFTVVGLHAESPKIPAHKAAIVLFNGKSLDNFDSFLKSKGLNSDPEHVFRVEKGVIHISGEEMGYIITKQTYHNFYLRAEFKWGGGDVCRA
jgi:hypothetical protein